MKRVALFLTVSLITHVFAFGQKKTTDEFFLKIDNDRFTPDATDKYYTSGLEIGWQKLIADSTFLKRILKKKNLAKSSFDFNFTHKIYTPKNIASIIEQMHDRPYASIITLSGGVNLFFTNITLIQANLEFGVTGKISGGEAFQKWWHRQSNITLPVGWENQISNSPIINMSLSYSKEWFDAKWLDLISESNLQFGTLRTSTRHGGVLRLGLLDNFHQSNYTNSRLGDIHFRKRFEIYFYYGGSIEYVKYNGLIQGNWIGKKSPHTLEITHWVYYSKYGIDISNQHLSFGFSYNNLSKEMEQGLKHKYASILIKIRI